jgi:hypothetical protein
MSGEQLALFASAITQIIEEVWDWEFPAEFAWGRWDMREFGARLAEVIVWLEDLRRAREERTG